MFEMKKRFFHLDRACVSSLSFSFVYHRRFVPPLASVRVAFASRRCFFFFYGKKNESRREGARRGGRVRSRLQALPPEPEVVELLIGVVPAHDAHHRGPARDHHQHGLVRRRQIDGVVVGDEVGDAEGYADVG